MEIVKEFVHVFVMYGQELWLTLAVGFLISGIFFKFLPTNIVERHLGEKGIRPIIISSCVGTLLPVCCIGSLPIALTLRKKGATLGAVLAFLVATPATSISALFVCWKLLGPVFTVYIFIAVIVMAIILGVIVNRIKITHARVEVQGGDSCCQPEDDQSADAQLTVGKKIHGVFSYAFVTLPKEIGVEILIGIAVASFITVFEPLRHLIQNYLTGLTGYAFIMVFGLVTYVCSTASVPMADAFLHSGMSYGHALMYLLVGPITSYGTILVIKKDFGWRILSVYLAVICILSFIYGLVFDFLLLQKVLSV